MAEPENWRAIRGERALNEARVETYARLMAAQARIAELAERCGIGERQIDAALAAARPTEQQAEAHGSQVDPERALYLALLERFVAALGGHLEVRAVIDGQAVTVLRGDRDLDPDRSPAAEAGQGPAAQDDQSAGSDAS